MNRMLCRENTVRGLVLALGLLVSMTSGAYYGGAHYGGAYGGAHYGGVYGGAHYGGGTYYNGTHYVGGGYYSGGAYYGGPGVFYNSGPVCTYIPGTYQQVCN